MESLARKVVEHLSRQGISGRTVTLPAIDRIMVLSNHPDNTQSVNFVRGSSTITLLAGETAWARTDGTTNGLRALMLGTAGGVNVAFTDLTDAPGSYSGEAGQIVAVNGTEDGLEFITPVSGGALEVLDERHGGNRLDDD